MAKPCKYCQPSSVAGKKFLEARGRGESVYQAAKFAGIPNASASDHEKHLMKERAQIVDAPPPRPKLDPKATPLDQAQAQHKWLVDLQDWATGRVPQKELAHIAGQVVSSVRLVARLSGALDVTEAQIVKSAPFARVLVALDAMFASFPNEKAMRERFEAELAKVMGE